MEYYGVAGFWSLRAVRGGGGLADLKKNSATRLFGMCGRQDIDSGGLSGLGGHLVDFVDGGPDGAGAMVVAACYGLGRGGFFGCSAIRLGDDDLFF